MAVLRVGAQLEGLQEEHKQMGAGEDEGETCARERTYLSAAATTPVPL